MFEICSTLASKSSQQLKVKPIFGSIFPWSLVFIISQDDPYQKKKTKGHICL